MIDPATAKILISRLNKYAFESFCLELLTTKYNVAQIPEIRDGVYRRELGREYDDGPVHDGIYVTQYLPFELLHNPAKINVSDANLIETLQRCRAYYSRDEIYRKWGAIYFLTNYFSGPLSTDYHESIQAQYVNLVTEQFGDAGPTAVAFGDTNSFVSNPGAEAAQVLETFLQRNRDGVCISLTADAISADRFSFDKPLFSGVSLGRHHPYESLYVNIQCEQEKLLKDFQQLIEDDASESQLEEFLVEHFREIFGPTYDRIETQLWLRFPDLDISHRDRRLDIFLRNSVVSDWELFEIKKPIKLTRTYRDGTVLAAEVSHAMQQIKNYANILSQDSVKKHFASEGIEYCEPSLNLVVGRRPQIPHEQFRRILSYDKEVRILTFDQIFDELKLRLEDRLKLLAVV